MTRAVANSARSTRKSHDEGLSDTDVLSQADGIPGDGMCGDGMCGDGVPGDGMCGGVPSEHAVPAISGIRNTPEDRGTTRDPIPGALSNIARGALISLRQRLTRRLDWRVTKPLLLSLQRAGAARLRALAQRSRQRMTVVGLATLVNSTVAICFYYVMSANESSNDAVADTSVSTPDGALQRHVWHMSQTASKAIFATALRAAKPDVAPHMIETGTVGETVPPRAALLAKQASSFPNVAEAAAPTKSPPIASNEFASPNADDGLPPYVYRPAVVHLTSLALRRAQRCDPLGHAVGNATVFVTFAPTGTVSAAHIEGEPVASAPVSRCILHHARSVRIARFNGAPFTYAASITMR
ncbi:MAG: hypothetical protein QM784_10290 [Polyangiaceae bacterium]